MLVVAVEIYLTFSINDWYRLVVVLVFFICSQLPVCLFQSAQRGHQLSRSPHDLPRLLRDNSAATVAPHATGSAQRDQSNWNSTFGSKSVLGKKR